MSSLSAECFESSALPPITTRAQILNAINENDIEKLQELSLLPGGFGDAREQAWPLLLNVNMLAADDLTKSSSSNHRRDFSLSDSWTQPSGSSAATSPSRPSVHLQEYSVGGNSSHFSSEDIDVTPHPDERQVQLDTDRSFVLYPVENRSVSSRKHLQDDLHDVILGVLRKRPKLRYFQGYHDIITVLFLTLPSEVVLPSAEKLSLHRLRDSMGSGLEPLIGQLRLLKRLLRLIDPSYAEILERNSPLPYYALSNLLTLFSHDVPTLPLIQHVFDWLLCREPVAAIWLAAAVILARKDDILALEREGEEALGMMHAVLSALPALSETEMPSQVKPDSADSQGPPQTPILPRDNEDEGEGASVDELTMSTKEEELEKHYAPPEVEKPTAEKRSQSPVTRDEGTPERGIRDEACSPNSDFMLDSWTVDSPRASSPPVVVPSVHPGPEPDFEQVAADLLTAPTDEEIDEKFESTPGAETVRSRKQSSSPSRSRSHSRSLPGGYQEKAPVPPLPLSKLLRRASELLVAYPPSSPALRLTETFGPQSVLCTSATATDPTLDDEEAEGYVGGDTVVLPPSEEEQSEEFGLPRKPREPERSPRRPRGRPIRLAKGVVMRRQTVVAGVVLLLGVAVALYGLGPGGRGAGKNGQGRWMAAWVGGLLGVGQRLGVGL